MTLLRPNPLHQITDTFCEPVSELPQKNQPGAPPMPSTDECCSRISRGTLACGHFVTHNGSFKPCATVYVNDFMLATHDINDL